MKQYCRYCIHLTAPDEAFGYCSSKKITINEKRCKQPNTCSEFELNPIDAFDLDKTYKPRKKREKVNQITLKEVEQ